MLIELPLKKSKDMDDQFLKSRMGSDKTPVYKTHWGANFSYLGSGTNFNCCVIITLLVDPQVYADLWCDPNACYQPETDEAADYSALANFIEVLNETPDADLETELPKVESIIVTP